jgi:hypothetical protein
MIIEAAYKTAHRRFGVWCALAAALTAFYSWRLIF